MQQRFLSLRNQNYYKLQVIENSVYRSILQAPKYIANSALRGEVGASSSRARDAKIKILFAKHLLKGKKK